MAEVYDQYNDPEWMLHIGGAKPSAEQLLQDVASSFIRKGGDALSFWRAATAYDNLPAGQLARQAVAETTLGPDDLEGAPEPSKASEPVKPTEPPEPQYSKVVRGAGGRVTWAFGP